MSVFRCPYCKEYLRDYDLGYCPQCGAVLNLSRMEKRQQILYELFHDAVVHMEDDEWYEAIEDLVDVLSVDPRNEKAKNLIDYARHEQRYDRLYRMGDYHYCSKHWDKAMGYYLEIYDDRPDYRDVDEMIDAVEAQKTEEKNRVKYTFLGKAFDFIMKAILSLSIAAFIVLLFLGIFAILFFKGGLFPVF